MQEDCYPESYHIRTTHKKHNQNHNLHKNNYLRFECDFVYALQCLQQQYILDKIIYTKQNQNKFVKLKL